MIANHAAARQERVSRSSQHIPIDFCSPTAKMDLLRAQLAARGHSPDGMSLRLLILEWRYDLLVLANHLGNWMTEVDRRFSRFSN